MVDVKFYVFTAAHMAICVELKWC